MNKHTIKYILKSIDNFSKSNSKSKLKIMKHCLEYGVKYKYGCDDTRAEMLDYKVCFPCLKAFTISFYEIFLNREYYAHIKRNITRDPIIIDCGANIGMTTLYYKWLYPEAHILAFEPFLSNYAYLMLNIKNNALKDIKAHRTALGNYDGTTTLYYTDSSEMVDSLGVSSKPINYGNATVDVDVRRLSNYTKQYEYIDLIKMDIERSEWEVIEDLIAEDEIHKVGQFVFEYHPCERPMQELIGLLEHAGFVCEVYDSGMSVIIRAKNNILKE